MFFGSAALMSHRLLVCISLMMSLLIGNSLNAQQESSTQRAEELFAIRVLPTLKQKCFQCHGEGSDLKGDYDVTSRAGLLKGGESGESSLVPGNPADSVLVQAVKWEGYEMPPKENDRLTAEQIQWIEQWVELGAPWPDDKTLVVWTGEFGRTPDNNRRGGVYSLGRGHNVDAMTMLFAGGGVKKGTIVGGTDEIGAEAVENVHPIRDVHVTLLHLLGLDDNKLTYFHGGRYKQLSQFGGEVIQEMIG